MGYSKINCCVCGEEFEPLSGNQRTCVNCKDTAKKMRQHEWYYNKINSSNRPLHYNTGENEIIAKPFKSTMDQLTKDAVAARKLGVSYGQYIAFYKGRKRRKA